MNDNTTPPNPFNSSDFGGFGTPERRGLRVPANAIHRSDLNWFVLTYGPGASTHAPQWLAVSSVVCERDDTGKTLLVFHLEWGTCRQAVAGIAADSVVSVSMHSDSDEAAHAADLAWAAETWGISPFPEGDLYLPADLA